MNSNNSKKSYVVIYWTSKNKDKFFVEYLEGEYEKQKFVNKCLAYNYKYIIAEKKERKLNSYDFVYVVEKIGFYPKLKRMIMTYEAVWFVAIVLAIYYLLTIKG